MPQGDGVSDTTPTDVTYKSVLKELALIPQCDGVVDDDDNMSIAGDTQPTNKGDALNVEAFPALD